MIRKISPPGSFATTKIDLIELVFDLVRSSKKVNNV